MDIRGAAPQRFRQQGVDQLDHRGVIIHGRSQPHVLVGLILDDLDIFIHFAHHRGERVCRIVILVDRLLHGGVRTHHRRHLKTGNEFDVVHNEDIGRIGHGQGQLAAVAGNGQDLEFAGHLTRYQADDVRLDTHGVEVDKRHTMQRTKQLGVFGFAESA